MDLAAHTEYVRVKAIGESGFAAAGRAGGADSPYWPRMDIAAGATDSQTPPPQVSGRPVPWTPRDVLIGLVLFIVALVGVPLALALPLALPLAYVYGSKSQPFLFVSLVVSAPAYVAVALIAVRMTFRKYGGGWARLGFARPTWATVGWGAGALFGAFALSSMYVGLVSYFDLGFLQQGCDDQVPAEIRDRALLLGTASVLAAVFAPVCEETFFRGFVFPGIARAWGPAAGIIGSGVLFGSAHLVGNPMLYKSMIQFAGIGMIFAFVYWRSGNIFSSMLAHFSFNLIGVITIASTTCK